VFHASRTGEYIAAKRSFNTELFKILDTISYISIWKPICHTAITKVDFKLLHHSVHAVSRHRLNSTPDACVCILCTVEM
jgi:hypothetical protein